jgi:hypothetical protein
MERLLNPISSHTILLSDQRRDKEDERGVGGSAILRRGNRLQALEPTTTASPACAVSLSLSILLIRNEMML